MSENGATMQGNSNNSHMQNPQTDQEPQQHNQQQNSQTVQSEDHDMLSNHNSGPSGMPGIVGMEADVDHNDVTGMNSNLYPPSSVSGDETGTLIEAPNCAM